MTRVFIISAPSGSGKSTLVDQTAWRTVRGPDLFRLLHHPRNRAAARPDGQAYHFISAQEFEARMERNEFLERAEVFGQLLRHATRATLK